MMTNQLPDGQWIRFAMMGEQPGRAYGLAGGLIPKPSPFDHTTLSANSTGAAWRARNGGFRRRQTSPA